MERFKWVAPQSLAEVQTQVTNTTSQIMVDAIPQKGSVIKAGGVDLLDLMKEGLAMPEKVVGIRQLPNMDGIQFDAKEGLQIGALATLSKIENNKDIKNRFTALHEAVSHAATPQVRNMATLGGNLAQRPRCWYFRSENHNCLKKGGEVCYAKEGQNEIHAIFHTETCPMVHGSSVATALMAFDTTVLILDSKGKQKRVPLSDFFILPEKDVTSENILQPGEIITGIHIATPSKNTKSYYIKQAAKESYDWALVDTAVVLELEGSSCKTAAIAIGAAAPVPMRIPDAENILQGKEITEEAAIAAGTLAVAKAKPLSDNAYKIPMLKAIITKCILKTKTV